MKKLKVAILGPGNIGTDLLYKVLKSEKLELKLVSGIIANSKGLQLAQEAGINTSDNGIDPILKDPEIDLVFDATSAKTHLQNAPLFEKAGKIVVDMTPAAIGPYVVPSVNMADVYQMKNVNLVSCGGQATIPIVNSVKEVVGASYVEIVATISSQSAGPGTRQNIDEFTRTTADGLKRICGIPNTRALILLNPADPPILMRNTIYIQTENDDEQLINNAIEQTVHEVQKYVPGYRLKMPPLIEGNKVTVIVEVEGAGDFLPKYSGNLDIITAAAVRVAEKFAEFYDKAVEL